MLGYFSEKNELSSWEAWLIDILRMIELPSITLEPEKIHVHGYAIFSTTNDEAVVSIVEVVYVDIWKFVKRFDNDHFSWPVGQPSFSKYPTITKRSVMLQNPSYLLPLKTPGYLTTESSLYQEGVLYPSYELLMILKFVLCLDLLEPCLKYQM